MNTQPRIITIGGSAGGLHSLINIMTTLNTDHPVSVFVVIHGLGKQSVNVLNNRLPESAEWDVRLAENGETIEPGRVYFAPSDHHMLIEGNKIKLTQGPKINLSRPAIDLLFRSAAVAYRSQNIAVVLSGMLYDGVEGMLAIKQCGGVAIVEDPNDAEYPALPNNVIQAGDIDYVKPAPDIGSLLNSIVKKPVKPPKEIPEEIAIENQLDLNNDNDVAAMDKIGTRSTFSCPECAGPLWEINQQNSSHFRCHTGHSMNINSLLEGQNKEIERTLRVALRTLEEKMRVQGKISESSSKSGFISDRSKKRLEETKVHVNRLRKFIFDVLADEDE